MSRWTLIEGDAHDRFADRACQYGDGLFETIAVTNGEPRLWDYHLRRLNTGCERLQLPKPDSPALDRAIRLACQDHPTTGLKLYWSAGHAARGYRRPRPLEPQGVIQPFEWAPSFDQRPWRLRLCTHRLSENPGLAGIKHLNRLDQVLGRAEWEDPAIDEGLMLGQDGRLVCGTMSNIVIDKAGRLLTPALDGAGVAGVVRSCLFDMAKARGDHLQAMALTPKDLRTADAVYLTNALIGVRRAASCDAFEFDLDYPEHQLLALVRQRALGAAGSRRGQTE